MKHQELKNVLLDFISAEALPKSYLPLVEHWTMPLVSKLKIQLSLGSPLGAPCLLGISGLQGTGKSTFCKTLSLLFKEQYQLRVATLSIDDFYLTHQQRQELANKVHPLFITRGVPGTHDIPLLHKVLKELISATSDSVTSVPVFDKAIDDRVAEKNWNIVSGEIDLILLEGWCVGVSEEEPEALSNAINRLEQERDPHGIWRDHVNRQLSEAYTDLFKKMDYLILLQAPSFEQVFEWRLLQEQKLAEACRKSDTHSTQKIMNQQELQEFMQHFERLSRHSLNTLPLQADIVVKLNQKHQIDSISPNK